MSEPASTPLGVGSIIDKRFEILSLLGEGGFGVVFKAIQISTQQEVAIKVLHTNHVRGSTTAQKASARFAREMKVIAKLGHPHIVRLIDVGTLSDGALYAAMEYVKGTPLSTVIEEEGHLEPAEAVRIMGQVLDALSCAHDEGVVHRDMKPDNIMLTTTGARRNALVLDFGIAGIAGPEEGEEAKKLTATGQFIGTPQYMAPEQLSEAATTPQTDIYAWGLVFLEALTGNVIIDAHSLPGVLMKQVSPAPVPLPPQLQGTALGEVLKRACAKPLDERFSSAKEALIALEEAPLPTKLSFGSEPKLSSALGETATINGVAPTGSNPRPETGYGSTPETSSVTKPDTGPTTHPSEGPSTEEVAAEALGKSNGAPLLVIGLLLVAIVAGAVVLLLSLGESPPAKEPPRGEATAETEDLSAAPEEDLAETSPEEITETPDLSPPPVPYQPGEAVTLANTRGDKLRFHPGGDAQVGADDLARKGLGEACSMLLGPRRKCEKRVLGLPIKRQLNAAPFLLDEGEATNSDYQKCVDEGNCAPIDYSNCAILTPRGAFEVVSLKPEELEAYISAVSAPMLPAVCISQHDAETFCGWAGKRLPSVEEWEIAAAQIETPIPRSQINGADLSLREKMPRKRWRKPPILLLDGNDGAPFTALVKSFPNNITRLGIYDLIGNVSEWAHGPEGIVAKGGSWANAGPALSRFGAQPLSPSTRRADIGFRCAADLPSQD